MRTNQGITVFRNNYLNKLLFSFSFQDPKSDCDFIVDYENGEDSELEPIFSRNSSQWVVEMSIDFLDASRSHKFFRAFYVPFTRSEDGTGYCQFGKYVLLKNKTVKNSRRKISKHQKDELR